MHDRNPKLSTTQRLHEIFFALRALDVTREQQHGTAAKKDTKSHQSSNFLKLRNDHKDSVMISRT